VKRITLGLYYPVRSPLHSLDGRFKILSALIFMVTVFLCRSAASFAFLLAFTLSLVALSRVPLGVILKSVRMITFIVVFTFLLNLLFTVGPDEPLVSFWIFRIYEKGLLNAVYIALRIMCLVVGTSLLISYTTTPIDITHSLESLLSPLARLRVPVHDFAMMMFIALRFIPTLGDDTDRIMTAQMSRGVDFRSGSPIKRIKSLIPILVPLFVSSFRRADELSTAMECRCYHGGEGRTSMKVYRIAASDVVMLAVMILSAAAAVALNILLPEYSI
jgi:energy-coupling factor transport system permease protein